MPYHEWTSCEVHGHNFVEGSCTDCGEKVEEDEECTDCGEKVEEDEE